MSAKKEMISQKRWLLCRQLIRFPLRLPHGVSVFGLRNSFGFRVSDFGFHSCLPLKFFVCALLFLAIAPWLSAQERVLAEWTFDKPGDLQGWIINGHIAEAKVADGALAGRTTGSDPILEYRPRLDIAASPWQIIEIRLKSDRDGFAQIFWSNTTEGRYGGFDGDKTTDFNVIGDGQWHVYRLLPFWQKEGKSCDCVSTWLAA